MEIRELKIEGYERVAVCIDGGYRGFIAVHSTKLGAAVGGKRFLGIRESNAVSA